MDFVDTKALLIAGGPTTVREAVLLGTPVPLSVDSGALVVLFLTPAVVPVTFTVSVHEEPGAMVPPPKFNVVSPGVAFQVPLQVEPIPAGLATCNPAGKLSEKSTPVRVMPAFGLVKVSVNCDTPPTGIVVGLNALLTVGGAATDKVALAVLPVPALAEVTLPVVLFFTPPVVAVTLTTIVQVPAAETVPPLNVSVVSPALGANVPPHDVDAPGVAATCNPEGKESVNPTPTN